jgi:hypothetical protein
MTVGIIFIVGPVWLATMYLFYNLFSEYPIMWLSLLGIPAGAYFYFAVYPEDFQKVKKLVKEFFLDW